MRRLAFILALSCAPLPLMAQVVGMTTGEDLLPMTYIDEQTLSHTPYPTLSFPAGPWEEARACLVKHRVIPAGARVTPPVILVVPWAASIRVHDMTLDSLERARDTTSAGTPFAAPTVAYTLVRSGAILMVERYKANAAVLRHEAIHVWLWEVRRLYGHPEEAFRPCDREYVAG